MTPANSMAAVETVSVEIGGTAISLRTPDASFRQLLAYRYAGFVGNAYRPQFEFDIDLCAPSESASEDEVQVRIEGGDWLLQRGDFHARWRPAAGRGQIRQAHSPYAIDSVLRIVHTLILARQGGFLLHAASAIRDGRAFLFAGVSGAGKTTISRLAPSDTVLLSDEISYVKRHDQGFWAYGTPFAGELARAGENRSAPIEALFFLEKGPANRIEPLDATEAVRRLLRNILFFANDAKLVELIFQSACEFVSVVPVQRLIFVPDPRAWEIIR